jgi:transcriptional regulator with XRE-family HTH domain
LLEERGLTLRSVSRSAGVDHAHLSRILRGDRGRKVSPGLAARVAVALDLPEDFFPEYREGQVVKAIARDSGLRDQIYDRLKRQR